MEKFHSGLCSATIHSAVSYCVIGEKKRTAVDYGTASIDIEREKICLEPEQYLTRLKISNISGTMVKLISAYPIITDDMDIGGIPSQDWSVLNGSRQLNDVPATCVLGVKDQSFMEAYARLNDEGMQERSYTEGDNVLYGDGITVIKAGKQYVALEIMTNDTQLTDISISSDYNGSVKAIRLGGEFNCLMESGDTIYTDWVRIHTGGNFSRLLDEYSKERKAMMCAKTPGAKRPVYNIDDNFSMETISERLSFLRGVRAPFDYIELGRGWQSAIGDWESSYGVNLSHIASHINKNGYKAGIWTAPFIAEKNSELLQTERKWFLRHADGSVCTYDADGVKYAVLDVSSEECLEWLVMLYQRLSATGFYMHHIDHTNAFVVQKDVVLSDPKLSMAEAYKNAMKAIYDAIGEDGHMCVTNGFAPMLSGVADSIQTVSEPGFMLKNTDSNGLSRLVNQVSFRAYTSEWCNNLCAPVIDCNLLNRYSSSEARKILVCEYLSGGSPMVSELKNNDELRLLKYLVPSVETKVIPRDAFDETAYINVVDVEICRDYHTLCFFNNSFATKELIFRLDSKTCGGYIDHASTYNISSYFGRERAIDCVYDTIVKLGTIPANSCEIVKIAKNNKAGVILSDMHFSMGGEVEVITHSDRVTVSGNNCFNCRGNYIISLPKGTVGSDGRREFSVTVNGAGPFSYEKPIKRSE